MSFEGRYLLTVSMDVEADKEDALNEVYDAEHVPLLMKVPGVLSAARFKTENEVTLILGGERRRIVVDTEPKSHVLSPFEIVTKTSSRALTCW